MAFNYKKEYKEFYMPKNKPEIVEIPKMNFIAVRGSGDPNEEGGEYKTAIGLLYGIACILERLFILLHRRIGGRGYLTAYRKVLLNRLPE